VFQCAAPQRSFSPMVDELAGIITEKNESVNKKRKIT
jgi:hypothetical protein